VFLFHIRQSLQEDGEKAGAYIDLWLCCVWHMLLA